MRIFGLDIARAGDLRGAELRKSMQERLHRLEIAHGELVEHFNALQGAHAKLRSIVHGDRSVRPKSQSNQLPLAEIPHGDKAALRRALNVVPGSRYNHQE